ncbi:MAG TPA: outer membrane beta-barrel protein [Ignavibacteriaceae bacterium]|nr:outer membrane beta-barrel protein [Ignavibacteriaceae bacterium]
MKKLLAITLFALLMVVDVMPQPKADGPTFGLGWYSTSAPIGGRIFFNRIVGVDLGLGYADKNYSSIDKSRLHVNIGAIFNVYMTNEVNFFVRPGLEYQTDARTVNGESKSKMIVTADLGAEWFVTKNFSLSVGHGLQFEQLGGTEDKWGVSALRALSFNNVGFHFYFN